MTGTSLAYRFVGSTVVLVHANCPPDPREFGQWLAACVAQRPEAALVVTPGPGPSSAQRRQMLRELGEAGLLIPTAIVTNSTFARGIVTAIKWFQQYALEAFAPSELADAFEFVAPGKEHAPLRVAVQQMQHLLVPPAAAANG